LQFLNPGLRFRTLALNYANDGSGGAPRRTMAAIDGAIRIPGAIRRVPGRRYTMSPRDHYNTSEFMSVPETARYLGVGRKMVYNLLETGQMVFARERGAIRILAASVIAFQTSGQLT
jgi:excisionase family DNA binding protein